MCKLLNTKNPVSLMTNDSYVAKLIALQTPCYHLSKIKFLFLVSFIFGREKGSGEQPIPFLFSDPQNPGMLLIGTDLYNKCLLIGENDIL